MSVCRDCGARVSREGRRCRRCGNTRDITPKILVAEAAAPAHGGCWIWPGPFDRNGYPKHGARYAHRIVAGAKKGDVVRHECDTPSCVNPAHLKVGTQAENIADAVAKGRIRHGERHYRAILSAADVASIRGRISMGHSATEIAREYGVCPSAISRLKTKRTWRHV